MTNEPIRKNLNFDPRMAPYVERARLTLNDYDVSDPAAKEVMERSRDVMKRILLKQKIAEPVAESVIDKTISLAIDYQLELLRRRRRLAKRKDQETELQKLLEKVKIILAKVSKLDQRSRSELNKITVKQCWEDFDTEAFAGIVHGMVEILPTMSPARFANEARSAINDAILPECDELHVREIIRWGEPALLELWETIPAATRIQTEKFLRRLPPGTSVLAFFRKLDEGLATFVPPSKDGRLPGIMRLFARRVARIWVRLGLHAGRAYDGMKGKERDSPFQSFCRHALAAVGDQSSISRRQVGEVQHWLESLDLGD